MSLTVFMQGICSAHTPLGLAVSRRGLESFGDQKKKI